MTDSQRRSYVEEICRLVGWRSGDFEPELAWEAVEREWGLRLPADFKELLNRFPSGGFRGGIEMFNPARSAQQLETASRHKDGVLETFADEENEYLEDTTYRVFPEPGGLFPWGGNGAGGTFFWVTDSADPDAWSVAYNDYYDWHEHSGPMTKVIHELLVSTGTDHLLGWDMAHESVRYSGPTADEVISYPL